MMSPGVMALALILVGVEGCLPKNRTGERGERSYFWSGGESSDQEKVLRKESKPWWWWQAFSSQPESVPVSGSGRSWSWSWMEWVSSWLPDGSTSHPIPEAGTDPWWSKSWWSAEAPKKDASLAVPNSGVWWKFWRSKDNSTVSQTGKEGWVSNLRRRLTSGPQSNKKVQETGGSLKRSWWPWSTNPQETEKVSGPVVKGLGWAFHSILGFSPNDKDKKEGRCRSEGGTHWSWWSYTKEKLGWRRKPELNDYTPTKVLKSWSWGRKWEEEN